MVEEGHLEQFPDRVDDVRRDHLMALLPTKTTTK
jgi:hypothetical protein